MTAYVQRQRRLRRYQNSSTTDSDDWSMRSNSRSFGWHLPSTGVTQYPQLAHPHSHFFPRPRIFTWIDTRYIAHVFNIVATCTHSFFQFQVVLFTRWKYTNLPLLEPRNTLFDILQHTGKTEDGTKKKIRMRKEDFPFTAEIEPQMTPITHHEEVVNLAVEMIGHLPPGRLRAIVRHTFYLATNHSTKDTAPWTFQEK